MCGICGIISNKEGVDLRSLLLGIEHRGRDATGVAYFDGQQIRVNKKQMMASLFVNTLIKPLPCKIAIGHTRLATNGSPNFNVNNHPVMEKETGLVLIHNGIVDAPLNGRNKEQDGEVDSFEILLQIAKRYKENKDIIKSIKEACETDIQGMYACALLCPDTPNKVYLFKDGNPIFLGLTNDGDEIRFASTKDALGKEDVFWTHEMEDGDIFEIDEEGLISRSKFETNSKGYYYNSSYDWGFKEKDPQVYDNTNEYDIETFMKGFNEFSNLEFKQSKKKSNCWVRKNGDMIKFPSRTIYDAEAVSNNWRRRDEIDDQLMEYQSIYLELNQENEDNKNGGWEYYS